MTVNRHYFIPGFLLKYCLVSVFLIGCTASSGKLPAETGQTFRISVIPFVFYHPQDSGLNISPEKSEREAEISKKLTDKLILTLQEYGYENPNILTGAQEIQNGRFTGRVKNRADIILYGRIFYYKERDGGKYAVSSPAGVGFQLFCFNPLNGKVIHRYEFEETQKALSDNLLTIDRFLLRNGQWVKAFDLAAYGIEKGVKSLTEIK